MNDGATSLAVGLVGGDENTAAPIRETGATVTAGDAATVLAADPDVLVAVGEAALRAVAREHPTAPILPIAAGPGVRSVHPTDVATSVEAIGEGTYRTETHPTLAVEAGGADAVALFDATLTAAEPARISAFSIAVGDETIGPIRADGVVVATPAGTAGYAGALDAPTIRPGTGVLAIEPIAQFATRPDRWVVPAASVTVTVAREEVPVRVLADDDQLCTVGPEQPVTIEPSGAVETVVVPASPSALAHGGAELEKH